uniref:Uncharacterized protein n=1 Tax=Melicertus latisulcatus pemonivirus TaxID=2984278 RepID=A0A9C7BMP3_9VIRU|nr:MAG: hypothetical protein [Melicertus latisulcatus pemonivirus]
MVESLKGGGSSSREGVGGSLPIIVSGVLMVRSIRTLGDMNPALGAFDTVVDTGVLVCTVMDTGVLVCGPGEGDGGTVAVGAPFPTMNVCRCLTLKLCAFVIGAWGVTTNVWGPVEGAWGLVWSSGSNVRLPDMVGWGALLASSKLPVTAKEIVALYLLDASAVVAGAVTLDGAGVGDAEAIGLRNGGSFFDEVVVFEGDAVSPVLP